MKTSLFLGVLLTPLALGLPEGFEINTYAEPFRVDDGGVYLLDRVVGLPEGEEAGGAVPAGSIPTFVGVHPGVRDLSRGPRE